MYFWRVFEETLMLQSPERAFIIPLERQYHQVANKNI